jgi:hypothetical protein
MKRVGLALLLLSLYALLAFDELRHRWSRRHV